MTTSTVAATPTTLNTFSNTYDLTHRPTQASILASKTSSRLSRSQSPRPTPRRGDRSYQVPFGVKSILKKSDASGYATASPSTGARKVFFPQAKKVGFKMNLEEEVINQVYTAKHSDLVWEEDGDVMESVETEPEQDLSSTETAEVTSKKVRRDSGVSFTCTEIKKVDPKSTVTVPSRKKRRWEWTLSPVTTSFNNNDADFSDLDSEWVVVSIQRQSSAETTADSGRATKRRAASVDTFDRPAGKRRLIRRPIRSNTL